MLTPSHHLRIRLSIVFFLLFRYVFLDQKEEALGLFLLWQFYPKNSFKFSVFNVYTIILSRISFTNTFFAFPLQFFKIKKRNSLIYFFYEWFIQKFRFILLSLILTPSHDPGFHLPIFCYYIKFFGRLREEDLCLVLFLLIYPIRFLSLMLTLSHHPGFRFSILFFSSLENVVEKACYLSIV